MSDNSDFNALYTIGVPSYFHDFIIKTNPSGEFEWFKSFGGDNYDFSYDVKFDSLCNMYLSGYMNGTYAHFDTLTLTGPSNYLIKFDSSGHVLWGKTGTSGSNIAIDDSLNIYEISNYINKYDANGVLLMIKPPYGSSAYPQTIVCDRSNVYIGGIYHSGPVYLDTCVLNDTSNVYYNMFFAKLNPNAPDPAKIYQLNVTDMNIYPNPAKNIITIETTKQFSSARIKNIFGQTVLTIKCSSSKIDIDIALLSSGVYFIGVDDSVFKPFVKQ